MPIRTLLFDLDGTLLDAFTTIHRAYQHTLPQFGLPAPTLEQVRHVIGGGPRSAMKKFLPEHQLDAAIAVHVAYTKQILFEDAKLMPGALELVRSFHAKGLTLAVLTNKDGSMSRPLCDYLGLTPYLSGIYGAGDTPWIKPQPEFAEHVLTELNADPVTTILIGDSPYDVQAAHNGGFACWCVTTGTHTAKELAEARADRVFANLSALGDALIQEI